jgi:hypothetical protein
VDGTHACVLWQASVDNPGHAAVQPWTGCTGASWSGVSLLAALRRQWTFPLQLRLTDAATRTGTLHSAGESPMWEFCSSALLLASAQPGYQSVAAQLPLPPHTCCRALQRSGLLNAPALRRKLRPPCLPFVTHDFVFSADSCTKPV